MERLTYRDNNGIAKINDENEKLKGLNPLGKLSVILEELASFEDAGDQIELVRLIESEEQAGKSCRHCADMEDGDTVYTRLDCDGGYCVNWHDAHFCFNCGAPLSKED